MATHLPVEQQVIAITGASSGIGLCTALTAAARGARLLLMARSEATLQDLADTIRESGGEALAVTTDVSSRQAVEYALEQGLQRYGKIDTWINNAGVAIYGRLDEVTEADSRRLFDINYWGVVNGSLAALPHLANSGGTLINIGSEASEAIVPLQGTYSASKHAVKAFTDTLRVEVELMAGAPVSVVLIQPTAVNTPYPQHARNYMDQEPKLPEPMLDPERVAEAILEAAQTGGRDVKVGAMAKANTAMSHLLPRLSDRIAKRRAAQQLTRHEPLNRDGTLYRAGESGQIHGQSTSAVAEHRLAGEHSRRARH